MKKLKLVLAFILCLALVSASFPSIVFATNDQTTVAVVNVGGTWQDFPVLNDALAVSAAINQPAYLATDYEFKDGDKIPAGATLIIPTNDDHDDTEDGNNDKHTVDPQGAFRTATIPEGVNLLVEGKLIVAGNQQGGVPQTGFLFGKYGAINLLGTMTVSGELYARGEIDGTGSVDVLSSGTVYQRFEISDWRGGNASLRAYTVEGVYPFNLYEANGLNVTTNYANGATLIGQSYIYSDQRGHGAISTVTMLGKNGLISYVSDDSQVTFTHDPTTGIATASVTGEVKTGSITVYVETQFGIDIPLTSTYGIGPFGYKQNVVLQDGAIFNVSNQLKVLPGCTITVEANATINAEKGMYFYTAGGYNRSWNNAGWPPANSNIGDAMLDVKAGGHVIGTFGSTTDNLSNITGLGELIATGKATVKEVTQSGTSVSPVEVTFQTVNLSVTATPAE